MNKKKILEHLIEVFGNSSCLVHESLIPEIRDLLEKSGEELKVLKMLSARLQVLQGQKHMAQLYNKEFELLGHGIYSMHIATSNKNIRILYAFRDPDTILLLAFHERSGKSKTDYTGKIDEALKRLRELSD